MNLNNFTIKAQEAVQQAVQLVTKNNQDRKSTRLNSSLVESCHYDG